MSQTFTKGITEISTDATRWRKWLHQNPELLFDLPKTQSFVVKTLAAAGIETIYTDLAQTGVVAIINGVGDGPTIGLRADMDALPIHELGSQDHKSQSSGKMHACGHDGHTAMLLGAAHHLQKTRRFAGRVVLVFQPAEEGGIGAKAMIKDGLFDRFGIAEIYGMHNMPNLPVGEFAICFGPSHASVDNFEITIEGQGSHAARPHQGVDPIAVAYAVYSGLQAIVSRNIDPIRNGLISVTAMQSGEAFNVIPQSARLRGTVRTLYSDSQDLIERRISEICAGVATSHGAQISVDYQRMCPISVNQREASDYAVKAAQSVVGERAVNLDCPPRLGGEDFAFMLEQVPGVVINLGNGDSPGLHNPHFDFSDEAIPFGISYWVKLVEGRLAVKGLAKVHPSA